MAENQQITPPREGASSVLATNGDGDRGYRGDRGNERDYLRSRSFYQSQADVVQRIAAAELAVEKTAAASALAIEKVGAASALAAAQNTARIEAQIAECCCEMKELVREQNGLTRDLFNQHRLEDAQLKLADTRAELLALRVTKQVPGPV